MPEGISLHSSAARSQDAMRFIAGLVVLTAVTRESSILWNVAPFSIVESHRRFGTLYLLLAHCLRVLGTSPTLKTEAVGFSETSVNFYRTTRNHTSKDSTLQDSYGLYRFVTN
jgi:hypothetical protein